MALLPRLHTPEVASVFCGGILSPDRLNHPEGLCVDPRDGSLWCGGEGGELYHISPDGQRIETVATTGGFILGVAMDRRGRLYLCDLHFRCVFIFDDQGRELARLEGREGDEHLQIPNYAVLSADETRLYVSDTRRAGGPGIWCFDLTRLDQGSIPDGILWMRETSFSANGLALAPDGSCLYLVESHLPGVSRIPIQPNGAAGPKEICLHLPGDEPDGLAFNNRGELYIGIYNPSRIYRFRPETSTLDLILEDPTTDYLHHATNLAFRSDAELFTANLGAWHLTRIDLSKLED